MRHRAPVVAVTLLSLAWVPAAIVRAADAKGSTAAAAADPKTAESSSFWNRVRPRGHSNGANNTAGAPAPGVPKSLAKAQVRLRKGPIGVDATGRAYLDLVDAGKASAADLNDFAIYLVRRGYFDDASHYQEAALGLEDKNAAMWVNMGTIQRALNNRSNAKSAYLRALDLDPNNAHAHYDLGTIYQAEDDYDNAVKEYGISLTLDPRMGDARYNPQVAYNDNILLVKLLTYRSQAGALGLPMLSLTKGPPPVQPPAAPAAVQPAPPPAPAPQAPAPQGQPQAQPPASQKPKTPTSGSR